MRLNIVVALPSQTRSKRESCVTEWRCGSYVLGLVLWVTGCWVFTLSNLGDTGLDQGYKSRSYGTVIKELPAPRRISKFWIIKYNSQCYKRENVSEKKAKESIYEPLGGG